MKRYRSLPVLKWVATVTTGLLLIAIVLTELQEFDYSLGSCRIVADSGAVQIWSKNAMRGKTAAPIDEVELAYAQLNSPFPDRWRPGVSAYRRMSGSNLPLWPPFLAVAAASAWCWWRDRRRPPPGKCHCGYDLTGNTSGVCPE
jgi:hypothetical protein